MPGDGDDRAPGAIPTWLKAALAGGGLLLAAVVVELAVTLGVLQDSREHIRAQDAKVERLLEASAPLARRARPLVDRARPLVEEARPFVRDAGALFGDVESLIGPLIDNGDELSYALERFPGLAEGLSAAASEAVPLLQSVDPASLVGGASLAIALVARLSEGDRLVTTLDRASALLEQVAERDLVDRAVQADKTLREVLEVQRLTLEVQRQSIEVQRDALKTQRRSLDHIRSLDAKTLGEFPPD